MVAELRASMPADEEIPSADEANQAVQVIVSGERSNVRITTAQANGRGATAHARADQTADEPAFWAHWRRIGAIVVGIATIAGAVFAAIQVL